MIQIASENTAIITQTKTLMSVCDFSPEWLTWWEWDTVVFTGLYSTTCPQSGTLLNMTSFRFLLLVTDLQMERGPENNLDVVTCVCFCSTWRGHCEICCFFQGRESTAWSHEEYNFLYHLYKWNQFYLILTFISLSDWVTCMIRNIMYFPSTP